MKKEIACTCKWSRTDRAELREIPRSAEGPPHIKPTFRTFPSSLPLSTILLPATATSPVEARAMALERIARHGMRLCFNSKRFTRAAPRRRMPSRRRRVEMEEVPAIDGDVAMNDKFLVECEMEHGYKDNDDGCYLYVHVDNRSWRV